VYSWQVPEGDGWPTYNLQSFNSPAQQQAATTAAGQHGHGTQASVAVDSAATARPPWYALAFIIKTT